MVQFSHLLFSFTARNCSILNWGCGVDGCETAGQPKQLLVTEGFYSIPDCGFGHITYKLEW